MGWWWAFLYDTPMTGGFASGIDGTKQGSVSAFSVTKKPSRNQSLKKLRYTFWGWFLYDTPFSVKEKPQMNQPLRKLSSHKWRVLSYVAIFFVTKNPRKPTKEILWHELRYPKGVPRRLCLIDRWRFAWRYSNEGQPTWWPQCLAIRRPRISSETCSQMQRVRWNYPKQSNQYTKRKKEIRKWK